MTRLAQAKDRHHRDRRNERSSESKPEPDCSVRHSRPKMSSMVVLAGLGPTEWWEIGRCHLEGHSRILVDTVHLPKGISLGIELRLKILPSVIGVGSVDTRRPLAGLKREPVTYVEVATMIVMFRIAPIFKMSIVYLHLNSHGFEIKFSHGIASSNYLCWVLK